MITTELIDKTMQEMTKGMKSSVEEQTAMADALLNSRFFSEGMQMYADSQERYGESATTVAALIQTAMELGYRMAFPSASKEIS